MNIIEAKIPIPVISETPRLVILTLSFRAFLALYIKYVQPPHIKDSAKYIRKAFRTDALIIAIVKPVAQQDIKASIGGYISLSDIFLKLLSVHFNDITIIIDAMYLAGTLMLPVKKYPIKTPHNAVKVYSPSAAHKNAIPKGANFEKMSV
jgi:hypothetical protein